MAKMADCNRCANAASCVRVWKGKDNCTCVGYAPIWTHFEMIKDMSEEELAEFLYGVIRKGSDESADSCPGNMFFNPDVCWNFPHDDQFHKAIEQQCIACWVNWLRQEVGDEGKRPR